MLLQSTTQQAADDSWQLLSQGVLLEGSLVRAVLCWLTDVADPGAKCLLDSHDLVHNLVGLQVASKAALACCTKGAPHRAAHLQENWQSWRAFHLPGTVPRQQSGLFPLVHMGSRQRVPMQTVSAMHVRWLVWPLHVVSRA